MQPRPRARWLAFLLISAVLPPALLPAQSLALGDAKLNPLAPLEFFSGIWRIDRPPHDGISDEYRRLEWDLNRTVLILSEYQRKDGNFRRYVLGVIGWNPLTQRIEFQEHADWGNFNRGEIELLDTGLVRRHLFVHYSAGAALHWRETWKREGDDRYSTVIEKLEHGEWKEGAKPFSSVRVKELPKE